MKLSWLQKNKKEKDMKTELKMHSKYSHTASTTTTTTATNKIMHRRSVFPRVAHTVRSIVWMFRRPYVLKFHFQSLEIEVEIDNLTDPSYTNCSSIGNNTHLPYSLVHTLGFCVGISRILFAIDLYNSLTWFWAPFCSQIFFFLASIVRLILRPKKLQFFFSISKLFSLWTECNKMRWESFISNEQSWIGRNRKRKLNILLFRRK